MDKEQLSEDAADLDRAARSLRALCICPRFSDTGGFRIADLGCPVHGVAGTDPGDGYWPDDDDSFDIEAPSQSGRERHSDA